MWRSACFSNVGWDAWHRLLLSPLEQAITEHGRAGFLSLGAFNIYQHDRGGSCSSSRHELAAFRKFRLAAANGPEANFGHPIGQSPVPDI
ncbi:hypothetical protein M378DRAFT_156296 [Amanita muscaria Koide BX008]|uniref:Uncharacterized protein n=1 Tax=Amanita muscaria (strain Koide BX008) TaxID=946122 RepID=A0A0C2T2X4_AMAMK|nr:hypothetical protein M378DRAFT_156296 [Amanita muscaria Koide BX008]